MRISADVALAPKTTFRIGGKARFFARACTLEETREALRFARARDLPVLLVGGGSNLLVDDAGFDGLALQPAIMGIDITPGDEGSEISVGAGEPFDALVARTVEEGLWGLENLSGVPGTLGGAIVQNIGAYGTALSACVSWVEALDRASGEVRRLAPTACAFGYRDSVFKHSDAIVLRAGLCLSRTPAPNRTYEALSARLDEAHPALATIRDTVLMIRAARLPDLAREGSAGSFFKNPLVAKRDARGLPAHVPLYFVPEARAYKVPLAYLLDHELHLNGLHVGGARLFERQPLVIAAAYGTPSADVARLAETVQERLFAAYGIEITPEVCIVGRGQAATPV